MRSTQTHARACQVGGVRASAEKCPDLCDAEALEGAQVLQELYAADEGDSLLHRVQASRHHDFAKGVAVQRPADTWLRRPH